MSGMRASGTVWGTCASAWGAPCVSWPAAVGLAAGTALRGRRVGRCADRYSSNPASTPHRAKSRIVSARGGNRMRSVCNSSGSGARRGPLARGERPMQQRRELGRAHVAHDSKLLTLATTVIVKGDGRWSIDAKFMQQRLIVCVIGRDIGAQQAHLPQSRPYARVLEGIALHFLARGT